MNIWIPFTILNLKLVQGYLLLKITSLKLQTILTIINKVHAHIHTNICFLLSQIAEIKHLRNKGKKGTPIYVVHPTLGYVHQELLMFLLIWPANNVTIMHLISCDSFSFSSKFFFTKNIVHFTYKTLSKAFV